MSPSKGRLFRVKVGVGSGFQGSGLGFWLLHQFLNPPPHESESWIPNPEILNLKHMQGSLATIHTTVPVLP